METVTNPNATLDTYMELGDIRLGLKRLHAGTFWYTLLVDMDEHTKLTRFLRLYVYAPQAMKPRVITNPRWIIDALKAASKHQLHECDNTKPCVAQMGSNTPPAEAPVTSPGEYEHISDEPTCLDCNQEYHNCSCVPEED